MVDGWSCIRVCARRRQQGAGGEVGCVVSTRWEHSRLPVICVFCAVSSVSPLPKKPSSSSSSELYTYL